jgi:hypothetical protein
LRVFYAIDHAVGAGCPNRRDDVLLVQFFLRALAPRGDPETHESFTPSGEGILAVDGICGSRSITYIKHFQGMMNRAAKDISMGTWQDGRVDPVPAGRQFGPLHGRAYTMIHLNTSYAAVFGTDRHSAIHTDPDFPMELHDKFFV